MDWQHFIISSQHAMRGQTRGEHVVRGQTLAEAYSDKSAAAEFIAWKFVFAKAPHVVGLVLAPTQAVKLRMEISVATSWSTTTYLWMVSIKSRGASSTQVRLPQPTALNAQHSTAVSPQQIDELDRSITSLPWDGTQKLQRGRDYVRR
jgi:hypothetical protein